MKTVIMAGGRGTRISSIANDIPKPMIKINGKPILEYEIECLKNQGFTDFIITVSYLGSVIMDYFGDGHNFGVKIQYFFEEIPLGNAGALFKLRDYLDGDFLLLNADSIFDVDFNRFIDFHQKKGGLVTLFTHPNSHPYDSAVIIADKNGIVKEWLGKKDSRPQWYKNRVNAGLHVLNSAVLDKLKINPDTIGMNIDGKTIKIDLDQQVLKPLCSSERVYCYDSPEYVKDMGTPERYTRVCKDFQDGVVYAKNLKQKQKAIFLDRDGTINEYVGFLRDIDDFLLLPKASEAIKKINQSGYLAIVVTNQPVIARGEISTCELEEIHNKMETLLGEDGAYIDDLFYCPHHPHKGYDGEIPELKVNCNCRKPKPGMLIKASKKYNIDLSKSWIIGDSENDILAGKAAGCKTVLLGNKNYKQDLTASSLLEAVENILIDN